MTTLTPEMLDQLAEEGQLLALLVSPTLLKEMLGKRLDPRVEITEAHTFGDLAYHEGHNRHLLVFDITMTRHAE